MSYRKRIDELIRQRDMAIATADRERARYIDSDEHEADCGEAQEILQVIAQTIQQQAHDRISHVVSRCLAAVFDEPYTFRIHFDRKRGKTEAQLVFVRDGLELGNPKDAAGGGVIDVAAFALRLSCLLLTRPPARRFMVLDEPFRFVSAEYRPLLPHLLQCLSDEFDIQIVMVTHVEELVTGKVVKIK